MSRNAPFRDALHRLTQIGTSTGVRLVRIVALDEDNRYTARAIQFDAQGATQYADDETFEVTNLAEPADSDGQIAAGKDAVALDVEGRWVVFVRRAQSGVFPARIVESLGDAAYTVREQAMTGAGTFTDATGAADLTAYNLAELSLRAVMPTVLRPAARTLMPQLSPSSVEAAR